MGRSELVAFIRQRGLAVVATRGPRKCAAGGAGRGRCHRRRGDHLRDLHRSRKYRNIQAFLRVAVAIGWDDELTVQCDGTGDILAGGERERCLSAYLHQYPDGQQRAEDPEIAHVGWVRYSDYRPDSFGIDETSLDA